jgi:hypothetical protein
MNIQGCLLFSYRFLLYLYPNPFRERFATEMMQLAAEAEPAEWPLILGDTSLAIVRIWLEPPSASSIISPTHQDAYVAVGGSALSASRLFLGLALSLSIILGLCYAGSLGTVEMPKCHVVAAENIS